MVQKRPEDLLGALMPEGLIHGGDPKAQTLRQEVTLKHCHRKVSRLDFVDKQGRWSMKPFLKAMEGAFLCGVDSTGWQV